ncbi:BQ5605_C009g05453 [Microbotryum silenes-dioicae]|uniref:BQ5605_C009g05453 protein n=1 Tax=Microbotryum silenes-dioicae TaxID=796604 RepID=A0A2X0MGH9_9BASI|nr:BQ5605_C009g05453 [Microbotryum silenes-dioicae]
MSYDPHREGPGPQDLQILQVHSDRCPDGRPKYQIVSSLHPSAMPLRYPLLFSAGEDSYRHDEDEDDEEEEEENGAGERKRPTVSSKLFGIVSNAAKPDPDESVNAWGQHQCEAGPDCCMSFDATKDRWATLQLGRQLDHSLTFDKSQPASILFGLEIEPGGHCTHAKHRCRCRTRDHLKYTASAFPLSTKLWTSSKAELEAMFAFMEEKRKDNYLLNPPLPLPMSLRRSRLKRPGNPLDTIQRLSDVRGQLIRHRFRAASQCIVCGSTSLDHPPTQLCHEFDWDAFTRSSSGALYHESSKPQVCFAFNR